MDLYDAKVLDRFQENGRMELTEAQREDVDVARKMFYGGCFFLPWLWIMNLIYYRHAVFNEDAPAELRKCEAQRGVDK